MNAARLIGALCIVLTAMASGAAQANTGQALALLHPKVKSFSCSIALSLTSEAVKQNTTRREDYRCDYQCFEDFNLSCRAEAEACPKLVAVHWDHRRYDLSGTGKGTFVGLDTHSVMKGGIDRRNGAVKYTIDERHSFQGDPIFIKTTSAAGSCRPAPGYAPVRRAVPPEKKKRRTRDWDD